MARLRLRQPGGIFGSFLKRTEKGLKVADGSYLSVKSSMYGFEKLLSASDS